MGRRRAERIALLPALVAVLAGSAAAGDDAPAPPVRAIRRVVLSDHGRALLRAEEDARRETGTAGIARVGVRRHLPVLAAPRRLRPGLRGVTAFADGSAVWTAEIEARGATGLRLHFDRFVLPDGASLTLSDADEPSEVYGPFTGAGAFHAPTVFGDRVRVELTVPASAAGSEVTVRANGLLDLFGEPPQTGRTPRAAVCPQIDVACDTWAFAGPAHAVAILMFASGGSCSGSLVADRKGSGTPWFLTADHCIPGAGSAETTEFYFDWYASSCGGTAPSMQTVPRVVGGTLMASSSATDVSLVRLSSLPAGRTMLPIDGTTHASGTPVKCVHHAGGGIMRVCGGSIIRTDPYNYYASWTSGHAEPGSSGAPLLSPSGSAIGTVSFGPGDPCPASVQVGFGRVDLSWGFLQPFLAPVDPDDPDPPPPPPPGPGDPPEFFWGLWNRAYLGHGESKTYAAYLFPPSTHRTDTRLRVDVGGPRGTYVRVVGPDGIATTSTRRGRIEDPRPGNWRVDLVSGDTRPKRIVRVRIRKNF